MCRGWRCARRRRPSLVTGPGQLSRPAGLSGSALPEVPGRLLWLSLLLLGSVACSRAPDVQFHASEHYPERLSAWGVIVRDGAGFQLGRGVEPYEINSALFSDYALKLRTLYLPPGTAAGYAAEGPLDLPIGSIISKTFFYPLDAGQPVAARNWSGDPGAISTTDHLVLETRLLVRQPDGWDALPYVWDGDDAYLRITGALKPLSLRVDGKTVDIPYMVPTRNECAGCHATDHASGALQPIGVEARHLNRAYPGVSANQLMAWQSGGRLRGMPQATEVPRAVDWLDSAEPIEARARAYLDINCGHCHNADGAAATSGLLLDATTTDFRQLGFCKRPIAAGRGSGGHQFSIVPGAPDASILIFRMATSDPAMRMPELGRTLVHAEAVEVLGKWIASLPGDCV